MSHTVPKTSIFVCTSERPNKSCPKALKDKYSNLYSKNFNKVANDFK